MEIPAAIRIAGSVRKTLAGEGLTERQAKLYSQRLRYEMGQTGLSSFSSADVGGYLEEAMWLIECALIERTEDLDEDWRRGIRRAAEILEFVSQRDLRPIGSPIHLLAAAAYQAAGFPAMALAQLKRLPEETAVSGVLTSFLRADFPTTLELIRQFWLAEGVAAKAPEESNLSAVATRHTVMCMGAICMHFKTGNYSLVSRAVDKLHALSRGYLHSRDPYSYLLSRLTAIAGAEFVASSLWKAIEQLSDAADAETHSALQQFGRSAFVNRRSIAWPAQSAGIARLRETDSFVLCTPTGSGKTTVATLAAVQRLFTQPRHSLGLEHPESDNLILYIVPSRALAAEVEGRLAQDLHGIGARPVIVTGLYGGIDWGPTDAWIRADAPTILICTFEKADALLRYLGVLFLHRVRLVVVDEVHMVASRTGSPNAEVDETSRELRLELLGTRLNEAAARYDFRIIALSAVAGASGPALARWFGRTHDAAPAISMHRSTRQMLGRIEVAGDGRMSIRYDLMDGHSLRFTDEQVADTPFVPKPFPPLPMPPDFSQPEKAMRVPALWAALHFAAERPDGARPSVLISVTQHISPFASECADQLDEWASLQLPLYRDEAMQSDALWQRCLASAADYFGTDSVEYRLLGHGIALHHGKMPGMLARRLKVLIDRGKVRIIIATSTLSEGVNIPVTYLLIPSVYRAQAPLTLQEFSNLIGRVGRPGVSTEGNAFVLLPTPAAMPRINGRLKTSRQRLAYRELVRKMERASTGGDTEDHGGVSPLVQLLEALERNWKQLVNGTDAQFARWLEQTSVMVEPETTSAALEGLNTLDSFLLSAIEELEQLRGEQVPAPEMEEQLRRIWRRSYAFATGHKEEHLRRIWLGRGHAIKRQYPDPVARRQIYRTSLSPRSARALFARAEAIRERLVEGANYAALGTEARLAFVGDTLRLISEVPSFRIAKGPGVGDEEQWRQVLRWWLAKDTLDRQPRPTQVSKWYDIAAQSFIYKGCWGLGSVLSLLLDKLENGRPIAAIEISDWPRSGLPWIAFWLKELLIWGTLEPVAAFLLARGDAVDRQQAQLDASGYYGQLSRDLDDNEKLNPLHVRDWLTSRVDKKPTPRSVMGREWSVALSRGEATYLRRHLDVMYLEVGNQLNWIDSAGYCVATSDRPSDWPSAPQEYYFRLDVGNSRVTGAAYRQ